MRRRVQFPGSGHEAKVVLHLRKVGRWGGRERGAAEAAPLQARTHPLVCQHRPHIGEGLPQHQLDLKGLEACGKEPRLTQGL